MMTRPVWHSALPLILLTAVTLSTPLHAQPPKAAMATAVKPKLVVAADGFPAGHATPEGVAADLARAFIRHDAALFKSTCIPPFSSGENAQEYTGFLQQVSKSLQAQAKQTTPPTGRDRPMRPKSIAKVFAMRPFSHDGPASYGYATFGFKNVAFVDVQVVLDNGETATNRTMVIQSAKGLWYVYPIPAISPLLSAGLNDESASTRDFTDAYTVQKPKSPSAG